MNLVDEKNMSTREDSIKDGQLNSLIKSSHWKINDNMIPYTNNMIIKKLLLTNVWLNTSILNTQRVNI